MKSDHTQTLHMIAVIYMHTIKTFLQNSREYQKGPTIINISLMEALFEYNRNRPVVYHEFFRKEQSKDKY